MMNFRTIKQAVIDLLGTSAAGRYRTIGFQEQGKAATEIEDDDRSVEVYYSAGGFPKSKGSLTGPVQHDITFRVDMSASKASVVDLAVLNNDLSTPAQKATALSARQEAAKLADDSLDELFDIVYQVLMNAENVDLGLSFPVYNRWVNNFQKSDPILRGDLVVLTASIMLDCSIDERLDGDEGTAGSVGDIHDVELDIRDENDVSDEGKAGVKTGG
jgi:hypothetical protein